MSRFNYQFDYDLGSLGRIPIQRSTFLQDNQYENDIYEFDINGTREINLSLNNISAGDDADLELYRDSNGNGVLDSSDQLLTGSYNWDNSEDLINYQASDGTYFARVNYYNGGSDSSINYDLDLSAVAATTSVGLTNNVYLDGILWGGERYLSNTITYSFWGDGSESFDDSAGNITNNAYNWLDYEIDAMEEALEAWENVANINFVRVADNDPNATFGFYSVDDEQLGNGKLGRFIAPGEDGQGIGYFNWEGQGWDNSGLEQGGYGFITLLHEIGHGLGLAHPHDDGGGSSVYPGVNPILNSDGEIVGYTTGDNALNQGIWTTMSYNDGLIGSTPNSNDYGWQGTPMTLDIAAIQHLYGANLNHATGNDTYQLPTNNSSGNYYSAIWDTGGTDTISANTATADVTINLQQAPLSGANAGGYVSSVTGISGGFTIANGVTIENAIGGHGNDSIIGNNASNNLTGGEGQDTLVGGYGNDTLTGSNPNFYNSGSGEYDYLTGGAGADIFVLGDSYEAYYQGSGFATITDFDWTSDYIRAYGSISDYFFQEDTSNGGLDILYQGDLIGWVSNTTNVNFSRDFVFV
jgi:serralysin